MTVRPLAALGGEPAFPDGVPYVRPAVPPLPRVLDRLAPSYDRGILTNGPIVRELEEQIAGRLGMRHAVAVASCTAGLMLALRALVGERDSGGRVLLPSFTFAATGHAVAWNGLDPVFAECDGSSFHLDVGDADSRMDGVGTVIANHVFGSPCRAEAVEELAAAHGASVMFDAASALGAARGGRPIGGFGDVEVFSLSPTKPVIAGEGGIVTTDDDAIAASVRIGRDYGNPGDYDTVFVGLNARLSELHAALAVESLAMLDDGLARRRALAARYRDGLTAITGIVAQAVDPVDEPTWKDLGVLVEEDAFGVDRDVLRAVLRADGVDTRQYFDPPVHRQRAYAHLDATDLPVTDRVATEVLTLPLWPALGDDDVDRIVELVGAAHARADELGAGSR